jgi:hypothetical protein
MIINKTHNFGFIHIPKCAGSTIRQQLRDRDDLGGRFYHTMTLPDLGRINGNHVPLNVLAAHFPEELAALRAVTSYAILRDPMDRFVSGISQYLRAHVREPAEMTPVEIATQTSRIIEAIRRDTGQTEIRNTIFYRQYTYVELEGERVIDHLFAMPDMAALFDRIETQHGLVLIRDKVWNPTVTYRVPQMSGPLKRLKTLAQRHLPMKTYVALREVGMQAFTTKGVAKLSTQLEGSAEVQAFVAEHYRADAELYHAVLRHPETA